VVAFGLVLQVYHTHVFPTHISNVEHFYSILFLHFACSTLSSHLDNNEKKVWTLPLEIHARLLFLMIPFFRLMIAFFDDSLFSKFGWEN
jgi:hypothetical protein